MLYNANLNFNKDFQTCLVDHLLACIKGIPYNGDEHQFTDQDCDIIIDQGQLYEHKTIWFRSMTYNAHRIKESAKPHKSNMMVLLHEDGTDDPPTFLYWHVRIIGIYHLMVQQKTNGGLAPPCQMDVLFVCGMVLIHLMDRAAGMHDRCTR